MPLECYVPKDFRTSSRIIIRQANSVIDEYRRAGFQLTLRQLYYQCVSRDWLANTIQNYKRLGEIVNDARLAGLIDWDAIIDRTRNLEQLPSWGRPEDILDAVASQYREPVWDVQPQYCEVWSDKDALIGVIERVCNELRVPYFACRGYTSQSEMWAAGKRLRGKLDEGKTITIFHLGDHDPSGMQMSEDNRGRLTMFQGEEYGYDEDDEIADLVDLEFSLKRIALNKDQIKQYNPPPNPAKESDSRYRQYVRNTGMTDSYELDALDPRVIASLIRSEVTSIRDEDKWTESMEAEAKNRALLRSAEQRWQDVKGFLAQEKKE